MNTYGRRSRVMVPLASERSERDIIRGVQIRGNAVRIYIYVFIPPYVTFNARDWSKSED